ncbi:membrane protein [Knoellia sinensis KCTC 19936]|uniref:Membrane protein n=1 Tax=Knoellia sinensis KCTC 19936 TaxID=1385520 RepID=A0A0A0J9V5_9MICO|nr:hypothetical protein [Knoellia sinensis]KGN32827.1 membrane protein [Knoellia sinensis KCTC 19936]
MYLRIIATVTTVLFALLAVVASVMTDLQDRSFPRALGATSALSLDFEPSGLSDSEALGLLGRVSDEAGLGLVRILPDLAGDSDGLVFVPVGKTDPRLPTRFSWFGDQPDGVVKGPETLAHSFATGQYLVTGSTAELDGTVMSLETSGVLVRRVDATTGQTASFLVRQESFRTTMLASAALMLALALLWLSVRARGRALRVLAGVRPGRIQLEDIGRLAVALLLPAVPVTGVAAAVVAASTGTTWLVPFVSTLVALELFVVVVTVVSAVLMSFAAWPKVAMIADRVPAVRGLRQSSAAVKAATFLLVVLTAGPASWAYQEAHVAAEQEARWKSLADQMALRFPAGLSEEGFVALAGQVGKAVSDADSDGRVALSYALDPHELGVERSDVERVALVNPTWLELMRGPASATSSGLARVSPATVPGSLRAALEPNLTLWLREPGAAQGFWTTVEVWQATDPNALPLAAAGSGDLVFPQRSLIVVVPEPATTFNDDFLASLASSSNLIFSGLAETTNVLREHGLAGTVQVKLAAEDGVLRAQFAAHEAWLRGVALLALIVAFVLSLGVSAAISALVSARRDYPLRLAGRTWTAIVAPRVSREWVLGTVIVGVVLASQGLDTWVPTVGALGLGLLGTALGHIAAASLVFRRLVNRQL